MVMKRFTAASFLPITILAGSMLLQGQTRPRRVIPVTEPPFAFCGLAALLKIMEFEMWRGFGIISRARVAPGIPICPEGRFIATAFGQPDEFAVALGGALGTMAEA